MPYLQYVSHQERLNTIQQFLFQYDDELIAADDGRGALQAM